MKTLFTLRDRYDAQQLVVCQAHGAAMPDVNGTTVTAAPADDDAACTFCPRPELDPLEVAEGSRELSWRHPEARGR